MRYRCLLAVLLLLSCLPGLLAGGWNKHHKRKHVCKTETPICQSDRFDVVFSHYDDKHCKVYKCKCRSPETVTCPAGRMELRTDSYGCQYYECITITCPQAPVCTGTQVSTPQGNDANGCPLFTCECPPAINRPTCNSNEQIQQGTDSSGCPYYYCQQVRSQCPTKPTCSSNQELVSAGLVGDCEVFKCVCLTPTKPACSIGSQARLQDDGLGCQEYRCVENRSPCPAEPICPSSHQVVAQDGVDANNCVKYVCKCIPLSPITCPDGYRQELSTDDACGCQYYKCEPNCEEKPNCRSAYQHAVVMATRNNGCPSYSCTCKDAEVINCAATDAHLVLTKANDGSNCDVYVCQTGNTRSCAVPSCANPIATGSYDAYGCPIYNCLGTSRNGGCPSPPVCVGGTATPVGTDSAGCTQYVCHRSGCPMPYITCVAGQSPVLSGYDSANCPTYTCQSDNTRSGTGVCPLTPTCASGETLMYTGQDANGCPEYVCHRAGCAQPPTCTLGEKLVQSGYTGNCPNYLCQPTNRACSSIPTCPNFQSPTIVSYDSNNCPVYSCSGTARSGCTVPQCLAGESPISTGTDGFGCPIYVCQSSIGTSRSGCVQPAVCPDGQLPAAIGVDTAGCTIYGSCYVNGINSRSGTGVYNTGVYNNGAYNTGVYNTGAYTNGAYRSSLYNSGLLGTTGVRSVGSNAYGLGTAYTSVGGSSSCPLTPECQYHQFRIKRQELVNGAACEMTNCINLGDYTGEPRKCLDNPTYCDISQTVETFVNKQGGKKGKACQKVVCKGVANIATLY